MTGLLRDLMDERADGAQVPMIDIDAIIQDGDQRVRRRRRNVGLSIGVGALAAATLAAVVLGPDAIDKLGDEPPPVDEPGQVSPYLEYRPTYAESSVINFGADQVSVAPRTITSFVQTTDGFVFTTPNNAVVATNGSSMLEIGTTGNPAYPLRLVSGGPYAAWVDASGPTPELVVYDTIGDDEVLRTSEGSTAEGQTDDFTRTAVIAIDGETVYWHNSTGVVATDLESGDTTTIRDNATADFLLDVKSGVFAMMAEEGPAISVNADIGASTPSDPHVEGSVGYLSPDGTRVATEGGDQLKIFDIRSLDEVTPPHGDGNYIVFLNWIDDDTYAELFDPDPTDSSDAYSLRTCSITTSNCLVSASGIAPADVLLRPDGTAKD